MRLLWRAEWGWAILNRHPNIARISAVSVSIKPKEELPFQPVVGDGLQDHPAAWDWRIIAAFVVVAAVLLFLL